jgi:hypothetical protein
MWQSIPWICGEPWSAGGVFHRWRRGAFRCVEKTR